MNIWLGLFVHLDLIVHPTLEDLLRLRGLGFEDFNTEYVIDEEMYRTLMRFLKVRREEIGGNAGNMAHFLGLLGIECNLSAPVRPRKLAEMFEDMPVFVWNHRKKLFSAAYRRDPLFSHIIIELKPPFVEEGSRMILTWDRMVEEGWCDRGFFANASEGLAVLSGFHLIRSAKGLKEMVGRVKELKERDLKLYMECGVPTESMRKAFRKLKDTVDAVGMNEIEARELLGKNFIQKARELAEKGVEVTIHSPFWVFSTREELLRKVTDLTGAWAMNTSYTRVTHLPLRSFPIGVPTRRLPRIERTKGLGDVFAVLDALRLFCPDKMEEVVLRYLKLFG